MGAHRSAYDYCCRRCAGFEVARFAAYVLFPDRWNLTVP